MVGAGGGMGQMAVQIGKVHEFMVLGVASTTKRELVADRWPAAETY